MLVLPFDVNETEYSLCILLDDESVDRIKEYDPAIICMNKMPQAVNLLRAKRLKDVFVGYANEVEDVPKIIEIANRPNASPFDLLKYITKGLKTGKGDNNGEYLSVHTRGEVKH